MVPKKHVRERHQPINHLATFHQMKHKLLCNFFGTTKNQYLPVVSLPSSKLALQTPPMAAKTQRDRRCLLHCLGYCHRKRKFPHGCTIKKHGNLMATKNVNIKGSVHKMVGMNPSKKKKVYSQHGHASLSCRFGTQVF